MDSSKRPTGEECMMHPYVSFLIFFIPTFWPFLFMYFLLFYLYALHIDFSTAFARKTNAIIFLRSLPPLSPYHLPSLPSPTPQTSPKAPATLPSLILPPYLILSCLPSTHPSHPLIQIPKKNLRSNPNPSFPLPLPPFCPLRPSFHLLPPLFCLLLCHTWIPIKNYSVWKNWYDKKQ